MDISEHKVTVPRDYLEGLEKFVEEYASDMNAKLSYSRLSHVEKEICLLTLDDRDAKRVRDSARIIILDSEGKEIHAFYNYL